MGASATEKRTGIREGVAKCISQACVYSLDTRKTIIQTNTMVKAVAKGTAVRQWLVGMLTSSCSAGLVFGTYFTVYHGMKGDMLAGPAATLVTSFLKVPLSNIMRLTQAGQVRNMRCAFCTIVKARTWKGLYSGYKISIVEDLIEFELRSRLYESLRNRQPQPNVSPALQGMLWGAVSGAVTAGLTTPLDTIKAHLAMEATNPATRNAVAVTHALWRSAGLAGFMRGIQYRLASNMTKNALFFCITELIP